MDAALARTAYPDLSEQQLVTRGIIKAGETGGWVAAHAARRPKAPAGAPMPLTKADDGEDEEVMDKSGDVNGLRGWAKKMGREKAEATIAKSVDANGQVFGPERAQRIVELLLKADVKAPGSRGGKGFYGKKTGKFRYGQPGSTRTKDGMTMHISGEATRSGEGGPRVRGHDVKTGDGDKPTQHESIHAQQHAAGPGTFSERLPATLDKHRAATAAEKGAGYQPKTGEPCSCRRGVERDNCPQCEGTGQRIDFAAIRKRTPPVDAHVAKLVATHREKGREAASQEYDSICKTSKLKNWEAMVLREKFQAALKAEKSPMNKSVEHDLTKSGADCPKCAQMLKADVKAPGSRGGKGFYGKKKGKWRYGEGPAGHQNKVAHDSMKMNCPMLGVMGGMNHHEAAEHLTKQGKRVTVPDDCTCKKKGGEDHEHDFGPWERSRMAGTVHRKCKVAGCKAISLDGDDD